eukprot:SAG22_NODE_836_length_6913_cov_4.894188_4_plen_581_part_00
MADWKARALAFLDGGAAAGAEGRAAAGGAAEAAEMETGQQQAEHNEGDDEELDRSDSAMSRPASAMSGVSGADSGRASVSSIMSDMDDDEVDDEGDNDGGDGDGDGGGDGDDLADDSREEEEEEDDDRDDRDDRDDDDEDEDDADDDEQRPAGRWGPLGTVKEFAFPQWQQAWAANGPRDFAVTFEAYKRFKEETETGTASLHGAVQQRRPPKELVLAGKKSMQMSLAKQEKEAARKAEQMKREYEREQKKAALLQEKLKKFAEREQIKQQRAKAREQAEIDRVLARKEQEEARRRKAIEYAKLKQEKEEERLARKREREDEILRNRAAKRARGSTKDEDLEDFHIDPPEGKAWKLAGGVPPLPTGELLMAWNFLASHGPSIACPVLSLTTLRGALSVPHRANELTDIHVALMRVLLLEMDRIPDQTTGAIAEPRRTSLLTALTWPYMACMYLEENADRLGPKEEQVSGMLWEMEYHQIEAHWKLELLNVLCNECLTCEPIRTRVDEKSGRDKLSIKKSRFFAGLTPEDDNDAEADGLIGGMHGGGELEAARAGGPHAPSYRFPRKTRFVRQLGKQSRQG